MRVFNIDISRKGISPVVQVTEYDAMSRFFTLVLRNGSSDYEPPENPTYSVWYKTNDSTGWYDTITLPDESTRPAVVADGNAFTVEIAEQATTSCGELALMINGDDGYQLTVSGIITRSDDIPGYDGAEVENYYNVYITRMQENAARAETAAATAIEYGATVEVDENAQQLIITHTDNTGDVETWVTEAEAWAVGQRDGVDVPSTDETYHNNAKYYAEAAEAAAEAAEASAEDAAASAASVESMLIVTEASGSVAAFPDGANDVAVKSLTATITPVQSGTGDPSPSNVRAISGRTGLTVTAAGKNLFDKSAVTANAWLSTTTGEAETATSNYVVSDYILVPQGATVYLPPSGSARRWFYDVEKNPVTYLSNSNGQAFTPPITGYIRMTFNVTTYPVDAVQVEFGNAPTTYEAYHGATYPISWQTQAGTVYGGTLNVTTGVLTVDRGYYEFTGDETSFTKSSTYQGSFYIAVQYIVPKIKNQQQGGDFICSHAKYIGTPTASTYVYGCCGLDTSVNLFLGTAAMTVTEFRQWLRDQKTAGTPVTISGRLATPPAPIQLSPTEIKTLLGGNTIYTDAGAVSVEYVADTKLYIDNKVAELQALILEN